MAQRLKASSAPAELRTAKAGASSPARPFNLTRRFSLLALACIASFSVVMAFLLSNFLTDKMLHRDAADDMEFVQNVVLADRAASFFRTPASSDVVDSTFSNFAKMPDVLRTNVYARDRSVIWSSDKSLVGKPVGVNAE